MALAASGEGFRSDLARRKRFFAGSGSVGLPDSGVFRIPRDRRKAADWLSFGFVWFFGGFLQQVRRTGISASDRVSFQAFQKKTVSYKQCPRQLLLLFLCPWHRNSPMWRSYLHRTENHTKLDTVRHLSQVVPVESRTSILNVRNSVSFDTLTVPCSYAVSPGSMTCKLFFFVLAREWS